MFHINLNNYGKFALYHRCDPRDRLGDKLLWWLLHRGDYSRFVGYRNYCDFAAGHPKRGLNTLLQEDFRNTQILGEGDFDITGIAINQGDGVPFFFHY